MPHLYLHAFYNDARTQPFYNPLKFTSDSYTQRQIAFPIPLHFTIFCTSKLFKTLILSHETMYEENGLFVRDSAWVSFIATYRANASLFKYHQIFPSFIYIRNFKVLTFRNFKFWTVRTSKNLFSSSSYHSYCVFTRQPKIIDQNNGFEKHFVLSWHSLPPILVEKNPCRQTPNPLSTFPAQVP